MAPVVYTYIYLYHKLALERWIYIYMYVVKHCASGESNLAPQLLPLWFLTKRNSVFPQTCASEVNGSRNLWLSQRLRSNAVVTSLYGVLRQFCNIFTLWWREAQVLTLVKPGASFLPQCRGQCERRFWLMVKPCATQWMHTVYYLDRFHKSPHLA